VSPSPSFSRSSSQIVSTVSHLAFWYDANDTTSVLDINGLPVTSGESVHSWLDKSGNGVDLTNQYGDKPVLVWDVVNGVSVIRFTAANKLSGTQLRGTHHLGSDSVSFFVLFQWRAIHRAYGVDALFTLGTEFDNGERFSNSVSGAIFSDSTTVKVSLHGAIIEGPVSDLNSFILVGLTYNNITNMVSGYFNNIKLDEKQGVTGSLPNIVILGSWDAGWLYHGAQPYPEYFSDVDIAEVIMYNKVVSQGERDAIASYLSTKYSLDSIAFSPSSVPTSYPSSPSQEPTSSPSINMVTVSRPSSLPSVSPASHQGDGIASSTPTLSPTSQPSSVPSNSLGLPWDFLAPSIFPTHVATETSSPWLQPTPSSSPSLQEISFTSSFAPSVSSSYFPSYAPSNVHQTPTEVPSSSLPVVSVNYMTDSPANPSNCLSASIGTCNLRSAWSVCQLIYSGKCIIVLPVNATLVVSTANGGALNVQPANSIVIQGNGARITTPASSGTMSQLFTFYSPGEQSYIPSITIHETSFTNFGLSYAAGGVFFLLGTFSVILEKCVFENNIGSLGSVMLAVSSGHSHVSISDCLFVGNAVETYYGAIATLLGRTDVTVSNTFFRDTVGSSLYLTSHGTTRIRASFFLDSITDKAGSGIYVENIGASLGNLNVEIDNCTFRNGTSRLTGGCLVVGTNVNITIDRTTLENCQSGDGGAALFKEGNNILIRNSKIQNCTANMGGGLLLYSNNVNAVLSEVEFVNCTGNLQGGGMDVQTGNNNLRMSNCRFTNCRVLSEYGGGAVKIQHGKRISLSNITMSHVHASYHGAGIYLLNCSDVTVQNFTVSDSFAGMYGVAASVDLCKNVRFQSVVIERTRTPAFSTGVGGGISFDTNNDDVVVEDLRSTDVVGAALQIVSNNQNIRVLRSHFANSFTPGTAGCLTIMTSNKNILIDGCTLTNCSTDSSGGGIFAIGSNSNLHIVNTTFESNRAVNGAGLLIGQASNLTIAGCVFNNNVAQNHGGGILVMQEVRHMAILDLATYYNAVYIRTAHPYTSGHPVNGQPFLILNQSANVPEAIGYMLLFDVTFDLANTESLVISAGEVCGEMEPVFISGGGNIPGNSGPPLRINGSCLLVQLFGPTNPDRLLLSGHYGFDLYVYPIFIEVAANQQGNTIFTNNVAISGDGGGIIFALGSIFPLLMNVRMTDNKAPNGYGGAVSMQLSNFGAQFVSMWFDHNLAYIGGAIALIAGQYGILVRDCLFQSNAASVSGGALYVGTRNGAGQLSIGNEISVQYSRFLGNVAEKGGAIDVDAKNIVTLLYCELTQNVAHGAMGGAVRLTTSNQLIIVQTRMTGNQASSCGGALVAMMDNTLIISRSIFERNRSNFTGGALCLRNHTTLTFTEPCEFRSNEALFAGGAIVSMGMKLWSLLANDAQPLPLTFLLFEENVAGRGSAIALYHVSGNSGNGLQYATLSRNKAIIGGTVYWIYDDVTSTDIAAFSHHLQFLDNDAPYGDQFATQAVQLAAPSAATVSKYDLPLDPAIQIRLVDFYGQYLPITGFSSIFASISAQSPSHCLGLYNYLDGMDVAGVVMQSGTATFQQLFPHCAPGGNFTLLFEARLGNLVPSISSSILQPYYLRNSTLVSFRHCQLGEYYKNGACVLCAFGTFSIRLGAINCKSCKQMEGVENCFADQLVVQKGFWRRNEHSESVLSCLLTSSCLGGNGTGNHLCDVGYKGPLCAVCDDGYYEINNQCWPCKSPSGDLALAVVTVIVVFICFILAIIALMVWFWYTVYVSDDVLEDENALRNLSRRQKLYLLFKMKYDTVLVKGKIVVATYQIVTTAISAFKVSLPAFVNHFVDVFDLLNVNFVNIVPMGCTMKSAVNVYFTKLAVATVGPIFAGVCIVIGYYVHKTFQLQQASFSKSSMYTTGWKKLKIKFEKLDAIHDSALDKEAFSGSAVAEEQNFVAEVEHDNNNVHTDALSNPVAEANNETDNSTDDANSNSLFCQYLNYFFLLSYVVLPSVTTIIFQIFICTDIDPLNETSDEPRLFLLADMSVSCSSSLYDSWKAYAVIMIFVYPIGIPAIYLWFLYRNYKAIMSRPHPDASEEILDVSAQFQVYLTHWTWWVQEWHRIYQRSRAEWKFDHQVYPTAEFNSGNIHESLPQEMDRGDVAVNNDLPSLYDSAEQGIVHNADSKVHNARNDDGFSINCGDDCVAHDKVCDRGKQTTGSSSKERPVSLSNEANNLSFLWQAYQPQYWYWEIVETMRRLLLTAVLSVIAPGSSQQVVLSMLLALLSVKLYSYFEPYEAHNDGVLAEIGQYQVFLTFFVSLVVSNALIPQIYNNALGALLIFVNLFVPLVALHYTILAFDVELDDVVHRYRMWRKAMAVDNSSSSVRDD
jgi:hypothetical protein